MGMRTVRVAIVDDDKEMAWHMRRIMQATEGIDLVKHFSNGEDFLAGFPGLDVDVVLMDITMPGRSGIECITAAKPVKPHVQFMVLTVFESPTYVFQALCAGATGYVVKGNAPMELVEAIRDIQSGGSPMSKAIARLVVNSFHAGTQQRINDERLTEREKEVLDQLATGLMYKEIAAKADISTETVRKHVRNIYAKLQVSSRMEAIRKAFPGTAS